MKKEKRKNKRAASLMVSYVLLIVIIVSLGSLVYAFLKLYLPTKTPECPGDITVAIERALCNITRQELTVSIRNTGLFNIKAIFVRMAPEGREVRSLINKNNVTLPFAIPPGNNIYEYNYTLNNIVKGQYVVEVQPATIEDNIIILCNSLSTQSVDCK